MKVTVLLAVFTAWVVGCGSDRLAHDDVEFDGEFNQRFVGDWALTGAAGWALLATETVYRFGADGSIGRLCHFDGMYFEGEAGQWWLDSTGVGCEFGDRWSSDGPTTLLIDARCSDGSSVVGTLEFELPQSQNAMNAQPRLTVPEDATAAWLKEQGGFRVAEGGNSDRCDGWL